MSDRNLADEILKNAFNEEKQDLGKKGTYSIKCGEKLMVKLKTIKDRMGDSFDGNSFAKLLIALLNKAGFKIDGDNGGIHEITLIKFALAQAIIEFIQHVETIFGSFELEWQAMRTSHEQNESETIRRRTDFEAEIAAKNKLIKKLEEENQRQSENLSAMYGQVEKSDQLISALESQLGDRKQTIEDLQNTIASTEKIQLQLKELEEANAKLKTQLSEDKKTYENTIVLLESDSAKRLAQEQLSWEKETSSLINRERDKLERSHLKEIDKIHGQYRELWSTEKEKPLTETSEKSPSEKVGTQRTKSK